MAQNQIYRKIQKDVRVDLLQAFDRNFETKSFFGRSWPQQKSPNSRGSQLVRSGKLRRSIAASIQGDNIKFRSAMPYASIHNEGGQIVISKKMNAFFWAMYYKTGGAQSKARGERKKVLAEESSFWKAMALKKVGSKIKVRERRFIGNHPKVRQIIEKSVERNLSNIKENIDKKFKR